MELALSYILASIGVIISVIGMPGVWLVFLAILISSLTLGLEVVPVWFLMLAFIAALLAGILDNVLVAAGAYKFGASKWGILGAVIGGLVGLLTANIIGIILGPFIGAVGFEILVAKKDSDSAIKAGLGTFIGYCSSIIFKFAIALSMAIAWLFIIR